MNKPTVGRTVHFYDNGLAAQNSKYADHNGGMVNLNGQGAGPYPAVVIQSIPGGDYINLLVHAWGGDWREGSVSHKDAGHQRYWEWPPIEPQPGSV